MDKASDMSFILELVAYNADVLDVQAARYYFDDLADCNEVGTRKCGPCMKESETVTHACSISLSLALFLFLFVQFCFLVSVCLSYI